MVHVIGLAQHAIAYTRGWAANNPNERIRWKARAERAEAELAQRDEIERIKDTRMAKIPPHRRPHYDAEERLAILAVRAAKGWSKAKTAEVFLVTEDTIASWTKRVEDSVSVLGIPQDRRMTLPWSLGEREDALPVRADCGLQAVSVQIAKEQPALCVILANRRELSRSKPGVSGVRACARRIGVVLRTRILRFRRRS